jgi:hypothetical protein
MESKDMFILLIVAGLAILLYAYWHFVGSKKEVNHKASENVVEDTSNNFECEGNVCPINSY